MGMVGTYSKEAGQQHYQTSIDLEPTGKKEERPPKEHMETRSGGGQHQGDRTEVAAGGGGSAGQEPMEDCCQWPMLQEE